LLVHGLWTGVSTTFEDFNKNLIADLRANAGQATSGPFRGGSVLILTTTGAKSGETRENPLAYTRGGDNYVVIASKGGAPTNPAWFHNLVANPDAKIEVLGEMIPVHARVAEGEEHQRLYDAQAKVMPGFAEYQTRTTRKIPVVVLEPRR
jgi:deazaflavin-dependent oxidoreductase (nitroreductase family)